MLRFVALRREIVWYAVTVAVTEHAAIASLHTKLSREAVERAKPAASPYRLWDAKVPGLFLRVQPSGVKSWNVQWSRETSKALGKYPILTLDAARVRARAILAEVDKEGAPESVIEKRHDKPRTFGAFVRDHYAPHMEATNKAGAADVALLRTHFAYLDAKPLHAITHVVFDKFRARRLQEGIKPATVNRDLDRIKAALGQAAEWGMVDVNPLAGVERIKRGIEERVRYLTAREAKDLHKALRARETRAVRQRRSFNKWRAARHLDLLPEITGYSDHLMPMTLLALNTGLRRGELTGLTWADINLERRTLTVRATSAKSGKARHIPLNDTARDVLTRWQGQHPEGRLFAVVSVTKAWRALMTAAKIEDFRFHDCRHDFASKLVMAGVDLNTVRELLGHADIKMTLRYAHLAPEHKAAAVELLVKGKHQRAKK